MFLSAINDPQLWQFLTNLAVVLGYLTPLIVIGWVGRGWLASNYASLEAFRELRNEFIEFKSTVNERSTADAGRREKLENDYADLMRTLSRRKPR